MQLPRSSRRIQRNFMGLRWPISFDPYDQVFWFNFFWVALLVFLSLMAVNQIPVISTLKGYTHHVVQALTVVLILFPLTYFFVMQPFRKTDTERQNLATAIDQSRTIFVIINSDGKIRYTNERFSELTGYFREEVLGSDWCSSILGGTPPAKQVDILETINRGQVWSGELSGKRKNGECVVQVAVISPLRDAHGRIAQFFLVSEDVTEKKQTALASSV